MQGSFAVPLARNVTASVVSISYKRKETGEENISGGCLGCRIKLLGLDHICHQLIKGGVCCQERADLGAVDINQFVGSE